MPSSNTFGSNWKEANKVFRTFTWALPDNTKKISSVVSKFEEYCIPRENTIYEHFLFFTQEQRESETVDQYLTELRQIAANCDFESITHDQLLWNRLVTGTKTAKVRENLLKEKKLTFEKAIESSGLPCTDARWSPTIFSSYTQKSAHAEIFGHT